jgi:deazaflavin-dependent oxidoreductase (nitroreductase family)
VFAATGAISDAGPAMAKEYRRGLATRAINWWFERLTRLGVGASYRHILTVPGRRTGQPRSTPVDVIELNGHRWLVAGYGPANWVLNARANGEVELSRGGQTGRYKIAEAGAEDAVPVLRKYISEIRVTRRYFDANPSSSDAAVAAELPRHPVLRLISIE